MQSLYLAGVMDRIRLQVKFKHLRVGFLSLVICLLATLNLHAQSEIPTEYLKIKSGEFIISNFAGSTDQSYPYDILVHPDASVGQAYLKTNGDNLVEFKFETEEGAEGMTEVVISYFTTAAPIHPATKKYIIEVGNSCVKALDDHVSMYVNAPEKSFDVLTNDSSDSTELLIKKIIVSNNGTAIVASDERSILFTPDLDFQGDAYVSYVACNDLGKCDQAQMTVHVMEDTESLGHMQISLKTHLEESVDLILPQTDYYVTHAPTSGSLSGQEGDIVRRYTPNDGFIGSDTIRLEYSQDLSRTFIVAVTPVSMKYFAVNDFVYTRPNQDVILNVLDNDVIQYEVSDYSEANVGTLVHLGDGEFHYIPDENYEGVAQFTYTVCYDSIYCETATAGIHVGGMAPQNEFVYRFKTLKNTQLPLIYEIPFDDYIINFGENPQNGSLPYIEDDFTWTFGCNEISTNKLLIYTPDLDFVGLDAFNFFHCPPNSSICTFVQVEVEVIDAEDECPCIGPDCVWSGDANNDGLVDMEDLLTIGWYLGETGPTRAPGILSEWYGENSSDWMIDQPFTDQNIKYADSDGDGYVTEQDIVGIDENYLSHHALIPDESNLKAPYQFSMVPVSFSLDSGDVIILDVYIGTESNPVIDMHGIKFSVNIPPIILDSSSLSVDFHHDSWLAENTSSIQLDRVPYDGRIDAGFSRANGNVVSGFGLVATISFIVEDDIAGIRSDSDQIPFTLTLNNGVGYNSTGERVDIPGDSYTYILDLSKDDATPLNESTFLFPNPATDELNVHVNGSNRILEVEMYNLTGQLVSSSNEIQLKQYVANVNHLSTGFYFARIKTLEGVVTKPFEVIR